MSELSKPYANFDLKQAIKVFVYTALLFNFGYYIWLDISIAQHTLFEGSNLGERFRAFTTTIDLSAWIILIAIYELETYALSDEAFTKNKIWLLNFIKFICVLGIAHTPYSYTVDLLDILSAVEVQGVTDLCQLAGMGKSYASNIEYTQITTETCAYLSNASQFFYSDPRTELIVQDTAGLDIQTHLASVDLVESIAWILIIFAIEINVRLQDKNQASGTIFSIVKYIKVISYTILWSFCGYWIYWGHYWFAWDEAMWIAGFFAIEMNLSEWRKEIRSDAQVE